VAPLEMMPQPTWTSRVMGHVTAEAARETGLASGTPVITGAADAAAEAAVELAAEKAGGANAYASLSRLASKSVPGSRGVIVLPYFSGEHTPLNDPAARGVIFGLSLGHTRADVYRAVLESVGYSIRHNIKALRAEDCRASRILAVGGGTRNLAWMQIVSDIAGIEQVVPARQIGASYGDAFLAGIGVGLFSGTADAQRWVRPGATIRPNEKNRAVYDAGYRLYRELYEQTKDSMKKSGAIAQM